MMQRALCFIFVTTALCFPAVTAAEVGGNAGVDAILARVAEADSNPEACWVLGEEMAALPAESVKVMEEQIKTAAPRQKLVLGYGLLKKGAQRPATLSLIAMVRDADAPVGVRLDAAALLGTLGGDYAAWHLRDSLREKNLPERLKVEVAKSMWMLTHGGEALSVLSDLSKDAKDPAARAEGILALGRYGRFDEVEEELEAFAKRPGRIGEEARTIVALKGRVEKEIEGLREKVPAFPSRLISEIALRTRAYAKSNKLNAAIKEVMDELVQTAGPIGDEARMLRSVARRLEGRFNESDFPSDLIAEVVEKVNERYAPDETDADEMEQLRMRALANEAAAALLTSVDPFNDYLDEESLRDMEEQLHSSYGGIGAWVGMRNGRFTILTPMYDKPAHRAGLRSMDIVEKIDDVDIKDMKLNSIIKMLKGPPGTDVRLHIWRRSFKDAQVYTVKRDIIDIPSVITQRLPGNIGYIKLTAFNDGNPRAQPPIKGTADLLREALAECKQDKVKGIILDLTNNPGGLLQAAVEVSQNFLGPGKLIVYSQGKPGVYPRQNYHTSNRDAFYDGELVVMVNQGSASASEIVAGALRDHERAVLVGEKTFGKGSVQQLIPLATTRGLTRMKLTIAKYYLPSDECIHKLGIAPDVLVEEPETEWSEIDARMKIRDNRDVERWVEQNFAANEEALRQALAFDRFDADAYPGFEGLLESLQEKYPALSIDSEAVRKELRFALRSYLRNSKGEELPVDLEENTILQHALVELGKRIEGGLPDLPLYRSLKKRLEERAKEVAAAKANGTFPEAEVTE